MLDLEEALARILEEVPAPAREELALGDAAGRVALERLAAPIDLPPFDNSAVDGYAVRSEDVAAAARNAGVRLSVSGHTATGQGPAPEIRSGTCLRLFTGGHLPPGADAVVMQEDTQTSPEEPGMVVVFDPVKAGDSVRPRGQDVRRGAPMIEPGECLTPGRLALLAATGTGRVAVGRRPTVGLLATGSELTEPGRPLGPGQIYESNRIVLAALVRAAGAIPTLLPLVADTPEATRAALAEAMTQCDIVLTTGGVSVGDKDFVKQALADLGGVLKFWRVRIRPGRPFAFGRCRDKLFFGLPGNPVSAVVSFLLLVRPALLRWQGACDLALPAQPGFLTERLENPGSSTLFSRVQVTPTGHVAPSGLQASHALSSLAAANGLVAVPPQTTLPPATQVTVLRWE